MSLFYNPQKSGKGVSKKQEKVKPWVKFWELFSRKFWYFVPLNMLYILLCVTVVSIGPATAAITHVMRKFYLEEPIFVFSEFWTAFKKHFKLKMVILGIFTLLYVFVFTYAWFDYSVIVAVNPIVENYFVFAMNIVAGAVFLMLNIYIYPQLICLDLRFNSVFKNALRLCLLGGKRNVIMVVVCFTIAVLFIVMFPYCLLLLPFAPFGQLAFLCVFNAYSVIQKYIINPFYETTGERNPEIPDYTFEEDDNDSEKAALFTDLGGKEQPINKKSVKTTGKVIR